MPVDVQRFRVFVSSTFEDLGRERDELQRTVFPGLRRICRSYRCRFQAIDLRWGVRSEAGLDQRTLEICLKEIERCQRTGSPNFMALLGERYGWQPLPVRIEATEFDKLCTHVRSHGELHLVKRWYRLDANATSPEYVLRPRTDEFVHDAQWRALEQHIRELLSAAGRAAGLAQGDLVKYQASATHQEILKAFSGILPGDRESMFVFAGFGRESTEEPGLRDLKGLVRAELHENYVEYHAGDLDDLCRKVRAKLEGVILDKISNLKARPAQAREGEAHAKFANDRSAHFFGRKPELAAVEQYLCSDDRSPLVVLGASGSGKSAVMAVSAAGVTGVLPTAEVIERYVGVTPDSGRGITLLGGLCEEISKRYGGPQSTDEDFQEVAWAFQRRLALGTPTRPLVVFIDALDQLADADPAAVLDWIPEVLPPNAKLVVSTADPRGILRAAATVEIPRMPVGDAATVLARRLRAAKRTLRKAQRETVLRGFESCGLPLYLDVAFEEARRWASFDSPDRCQLGEGLAGAFQTVFARLAAESDHGRLLTERALGYLAAARHGLAEDEIIDLLSEDADVWQDLVTHAHYELAEHQLPMAVWSRFYLDLEPYLTEREPNEAALIVFYHRMIREAVLSEYVDEDAEVMVRRHLVRYFGSQANWEKSPNGADAQDGGHLEKTRVPNSRKTDELPWQLVHVDQAKATSLLCDIDFVRAKCSAGLIWDLVDDYARCITAAGDMASVFDAAPIAEYYRFMRSEAHVLARYPELMLQQATNQPSGTAPERDATRYLRQAGMPYFQSSSKPARPRRLATLKGHTDQLLTCCVDPAGTTIVTGGRDGVRVWDPATGKLAGPVMFPGEYISFAHWSQRGLIIASNQPQHQDAKDIHGRVRMLGTSEPFPILHERRIPASVHAAALSHDGQVVLAACHDGARVYAIQSPGEYYVAEVGGGVATCCLALSPKAMPLLEISPLSVSLFAVGCWGANVYVLAVGGDLGLLPPSPTLVCQVLFWGEVNAGPMRGDINCCCASPDGDRVLTGSRNGEILLWDWQKGGAARTVGRHKDGVTACAWSADGQFLVTGAADGSLAYWRADTYEQVDKWEHASYVTGCAWDPKGRFCITVANDRLANVWAPPS